VRIRGPLGDEPVDDLAIGQPVGDTSRSRLVKP